MTSAAKEATADTEPLEASAKHDLESTAEQSETIESRATEAEHVFSPVEDKTDVADGKTSDIIKPAEEAKVDGETAAVAVATGIAVASAAVVITNELPTDRPSLVEAVTMIDHSADIPPIEAVSTQVDATETVVPSPEPTVEDVPLSTTVGPDVDSSLESKARTEPPDSEILVERTAIEPGVIVDEQTENRVETEASPAATQVVPASVTDVAPIATEAITEVGETVGVLEQVICRHFFDRKH